METNAAIRCLLIRTTTNFLNHFKTKPVRYFNSQFLVTVQRLQINNWSHNQLYNPLELIRNNKMKTIRAESQVGRYILYLDDNTNKLTNEIITGWKTSPCSSYARNIQFQKSKVSSKIGIRMVKFLIYFSFRRRRRRFARESAARRRELRTVKAATHWRPRLRCSRGITPLRPLSSPESQNRFITSPWIGDRTGVELLL